MLIMTFTKRFGAFSRTRYTLCIWRCVCLCVWQRERERGRRREDNDGALSSEKVWNGQWSLLLFLLASIFSHFVRVSNHLFIPIWLLLYSIIVHFLANGQIIYNVHIHKRMNKKKTPRFAMRTIAQQHPDLTLLLYVSICSGRFFFLYLSMPNSLAPHVSTYENRIVFADWRHNKQTKKIKQQRPLHHYIAIH